MTNRRDEATLQLRVLAEEIPEPIAMPQRARMQIRTRVATIAAALALITVAGVSALAALDDGGPPVPPAAASSDALAAIRGRIAFLSNRTNSHGQGIFILDIRADENHVYPIRVRDFEGYDLAWAPGGDRIVFNRAVEEGGSQLVVVSLSDSAERVVVGDTPEETRLQPVSASWSPDGDFIAFSTGDGSVFRVTPTGENLMRLTEPQPRCFDAVPAWSPDSAEIAFSRDCGGDTRIFTMTRDGEVEEALTEGPWDTDPAWSPDGTEVAFSRRTDTEQIFVASRAGGPARQVTEAGNNFTPTWSPDGTAIAFASNRDGDINLYVADRTGVAEDQLTFKRSDETSPAWGPPDR